MRLSEYFPLDLQKSLDAAVFFYPLIQKDVYQLCGRITTQIAESQSKGYTFKHYFILLNSLDDEENFREGIELQAELISSESVTYIAGADFKLLRDRMQKIFRGSCSYLVFNDDETGGNSETIKNNLPDFTFCGKMHIFLNEKNEKLLRGLGEGAHGLDISDFL